MQFLEPSVYAELCNDVCVYKIKFVFKKRNQHERKEKIVKCFYLF